MLPFIRQAKASDLTIIISIIKEGQTNLKADQVPQWTNGYPDITLIKNDIDSGEAYVLTNNQSIFGYAVLHQEIDPNYTTPLTGQWSNPLPYVSFHRVVIASAYRGQHFGQFFFSNLFSTAHALGFQSVRIDTHAKNQRMQHLITKAGFTYACTIMINENKHDLRWAYERNLN